MAPPRQKRPKPPSRGGSKARDRRTSEEKLPRLIRPSAAKALKPRPRLKKRGIKGRTRTRPDPKPRGLTEQAEVFLRRGESLPTDFKQKGSEPQRPDDEPQAVFKRLAYKLIRNTISSIGGHQTIKNIHRSKGIDHKGPSYDENPFFWGLIGIYYRTKGLTRHQLGLFSRQMLYAHRNDVPPALLTGFLYQIGERDKLSRKIKENEREPWDQDDLVERFEKLRE